MTKEQLVEKINDWTSDLGESFTDYFMHDCIKNIDWAKWLLDNGYTEKANELLEIIESGEDYIDQETLYEIYPEYNDNGRWDRESYDKNVEIWADFLVNNPFYLKRVIKFFDEFETDE